MFTQKCSRRYVTEVDREAFDLQQSSGISHKDALFKAGPRKQLLCTVCEWHSMEAWPLPVARPGPEEQAEGQLTGEGDRQGQQKAAGSPVQGQGGNEAGSSIIVKQQALTAYSYCLNPSLLSAGSAAACNHDLGDATSGFLDSYQFTSCIISLSKLISFVSKTTS